MTKPDFERAPTGVSIFDGEHGQRLLTLIHKIIRAALPAGENTNGMMLITFNRQNGVDVGVGGCQCDACKMNTIGAVGHHLGAEVQMVETTGTSGMVH